MNTTRRKFLISSAFLVGTLPLYIKADEKKFLKNGIRWLHETSQDVYKKSYYHLSNTERQKILHTISQEDWGEIWLWSVMSYFFEAMLGDPIYGENQKQKGWEYLNLISGYPRPKVDTFIV